MKRPPTRLQAPQPLHEEFWMNSGRFCKGYALVSIQEIVPDTVMTEIVMCMLAGSYASFLACRPIVSH
jgi:hypothetical protein